MPGTAKSYKTDKVLLGAGDIWGNLAIPGASARLSLDATTLTPDSTANPSAFHLGATKAGSVVEITTSLEEYFADEFSEPILTNVSQVAAAVSGELYAVTDMTLLELLSPGTGTKGSGTGYEELSLGRRAMAYTSIAIIAKLVEDPTKVAVFQLYKAANTAGIKFPFGQKELASTPFNFKGYGITSRAATDTLGKFWKQVV